MHGDDDDVYDYHIEDDTVLHQHHIHYRHSTVDDHRDNEDTRMMFSIGHMMCTVFFNEAS